MCGAGGVGDEGACPLAGVGARRKRPADGCMGWTDLAEILVDFSPRVWQKAHKILAKFLHRRPRKCVSKETFKGKISRPKLKGRGLMKTHNSYHMTNTEIKFVSMLRPSMVLFCSASHSRLGAA